MFKHESSMSRWKRTGWLHNFPTATDHYHTGNLVTKNSRPILKKENALSFQVAKKFKRLVLSRRTFKLFR